ncbi:MAG: hypothetical protein WDZ35_03470 [Crocinitomicaceae bacterium]
MKKSAGLSVLFLFAYAFCAFADHEDGSKKMTKLFECGQQTAKNFNGWKIHGLPDHANTYFESDHLEVFQYQAGNYSVGLERKIENMVGFSDLLISLDIQAIENCVINHTTAYVSVDGKHWDSLQKDPRSGARIYHEQMNYLFIRLVADVQFFQQARFRFNKVSVFGDYTAVKKRQCRRAFSPKSRAAQGLKK